MPYKPLRPCRYPNCRNKCEAGNQYCAEHMPKKDDSYRDNATDRGYDSAWREARKAFLSAHPLCAECLRIGRYVPATVVDHVIPHRGDKKLFWDKHNWQPLCATCHNRKTYSGR